MNDYPGVNADTFCAKYGELCGFSGVYATMAACTANYGATSGNNRSCRAGHLCNASTYAAGSALRTTHCGHSTGTGPCN